MRAGGIYVYIIGMRSLVVPFGWWYFRDGVLFFWFDNNFAWLATIRLSVSAQLTLLLKSWFCTSIAG